MDRVFLVLFVIVLFCLPFIGWETGWQTAHVSFVNFFIYMIFSVIGLSILFSHIQKKHLPDSRLIKISIFIAFLFSPLILTVPLLFVAQDLLLPSGIVLPLTAVMLVTGEENIVTVPFHYFIIPIVTFLFIYSRLWIITRRYHLFSDRRAESGRVFLDFANHHKRAAIIISVVVVVVVALRILSQSWISRYYLPISDEYITSHKKATSYTQIKVPWSYPLFLLININCQDLEGLGIFLLSNDEEPTECIVSTSLWLEKESELNFDFTNKKFVLRDIKNHDYIYPYTVHITSESIGDIHRYVGPKGEYTRQRNPSMGPSYRSLGLRYVFKIPPEQIELVVPAIQIEGKEYELSPIRFKYKEELKFGRPYE